MRIYQCDDCGEQRRPVITIYPETGQADFCSMECLRSWAVDVAVEGYLADLGLIQTSERNSDG